MLRCGAILVLVFSATGAVRAPSAPAVKASERLRAGDLQAAESELRAAIQSGASDPNVYNLMGLICSRTNRAEQAIGYYRQALRFEPDFEAARNGLGAAYIEHGDLDEAFKLFGAVLQSAPNDVTALFNLGVIFAEQGRYADSIAQLQRARKFSPADPVLDMWLARVQLVAGRVKESTASLDAALGVMAQSSPGRANAGLIAEALEISTRLRALSTDSKTLFLQAQAEFLAGKYDAAIENLNAMPQKDREAEYYKLLGMCYAGMNQPAAAIAALRKGIEFSPARADLFFSLGSVYQASGENENAIHAFKQAIAAGDRSPEVRFALALSYFNLGGYPESMNQSKLAIRQNPEFDQAWLLLGRSYARMAQQSQAVGAIRKALAINPACRQCYFQLGLLLSEGDQQAEAERLMREAIRLNAADAAAHYELGRILAKERQNTEAIAELRKTIELDPEHDRAYYQLGRVYLAIGDQAEAKKCLDAVRDLKEKRRAAAEERVGRSR